jgi:hypothetical protein
MATTGVTRIDETPDIPTEAIKLLLGNVSVAHADADTAAAIAEAHAAVVAWLAWAEREPGFVTYRDGERFEVDPKFAALGGCPKCRLRDGCVSMRGECWAYCETHRTKWAVSFVDLPETVIFDDYDLWEREKNPVSEFSVVTPVIFGKPETVADSPKVIPFKPRKRDDVEG